MPNYNSSTNTPQAPLAKMALDAQERFAPTPPAIIRLETPLPLLPFPLNSLPAGVADYARAIQESMLVPADFPGAFILGAASMAVAKKVEVYIQPKFIEPVNLYILLASEPGTKKSPVFKAITSPIDAYEKELRIATAPAVKQSESDRRILEMQLKAAESLEAGLEKSNKAANDKAMAEANRRELTAKLSQFQDVVRPKLKTKDATQEKLAILLARHQGRMAIMDDESGVFDTMAGLYTHGTPNINLYLDGWSRGGVDRERVGGDEVAIADDIHLTMVLAAQPAALKSFAKNPIMKDRGLLDRFLFAIPTKLPLPEGTGLHTIPLPPELDQLWSGILLTLLRLPVADAPRTLYLSPEADERIDSYAKVFNPKYQEHGPLEGMSGWGLKHIGTVARIAGILHCMEWAAAQVAGADDWTSPDQYAISGDTATHAVELGEYFTSHAKEAYGIMSDAPSLQAVKHLWEVIKRRGWRDFTLRQLHQLVRRQYTRPQVAEYLEDLAERNYIFPIGPQVNAKGGRPSGKYEVNPLA